MMTHVRDARRLISLGGSAMFLFLFLPILLLALTTPVQAADVTVTLDAGGAFVVQDNTATIERLRVDGATGDISRNGELFLHTTGVGNNTFLGEGAGNPLAGGEDNTALGQGALSNSLSGVDNVAVGSDAGSNQTVGSHNVYISNTGVAGESGQIKIGNTLFHTQTTIAGIHNNTSTSGIPVLVNANGTLGTMTSSIRFKEAVRGMGEASEILMRLRPVTFRYRKDQADGQEVAQYGLIAEEVAELAPDLGVHDAEGRPHSVRYHVRAPMLLNEMQKQQRVIQEQRTQLALEAQRNSEQRSLIAALADRLERVEESLAPTQTQADR